MQISLFNKCSRCGKEKTLVDFHKDKNRPNGRNSICKECRKAIDKNQYDTNRDRIVLRKRNWRQESALYATFAHQFKFCNDVRRAKDNPDLLEIKCVKPGCPEWFKPTNSACQRRLDSLNHINKGEGNFYCSDKCKEECPIFGKSWWPEGEGPDNSRPGQAEWAKMVFERADGICEVEGCDEPASVAHHKNPVKTHPLESMDLDNGIAVCDKHNKEFHNQPGMRYVDLAQTKMCVIQDGEQVEI